MSFLKSFDTVAADGCEVSRNGSWNEHQPDASFGNPALITGQENAWFRWVLKSMPAGVYKIEATSPVHENYSTRTPYQVTTGAVMQISTTVDQRNGSAGAGVWQAGHLWHELGEVTHAGGDIEVIAFGNDEKRPSDGKSAACVADGIRVTEVEQAITEPAPTPEPEPVPEPVPEPPGVVVPTEDLYDWVTPLPAFRSPEWVLRLHHERRRACFARREFLTARLLKLEEIGQRYYGLRELIQLQLQLVDRDIEEVDLWIAYHTKVLEDVGI